MDFNEDMYTEEELAFREEMHEKIAGPISLITKEDNIIQKRMEK